MRWISMAVILSVAGCGGPPALQNAPRPDPSVVAGAAALVAGAATLAAPDKAGKKPEKNVDEGHDPTQRVDETVPADVLDRLDAKKKTETKTKTKAKTKTKTSTSTSTSTSTTDRP